MAEQVWAACGVPSAPHRVVPVQRAPLLEATEALSGPLGAVWSGDARDGFNGGADFVRWVTDEAAADAALAFFAERCDHVRVMPFLDGVPCSIHGMVLPDGTAAFRPVEIAMLRDHAARTFVYGGLSTFWDPPVADRAEGMRSVAKRVGAHLAAAHGYRGAFGVDGVLTADGFRPTKLNPRLLRPASQPWPRWPEAPPAPPGQPAGRPYDRGHGARRGVAGPADGRRAQWPAARHRARRVPRGAGRASRDLGRSRAAPYGGQHRQRRGRCRHPRGRVRQGQPLRGPAARRAPRSAQRRPDAPAGPRAGTRLPEVEVAPDLRVGPRHADSARARGGDPPR